MNQKIENEFLSVQINYKGAELSSIKDRQSGFEFMWQADASIWGRTAPVLFPVVGKLKDDTLIINGNKYSMGQHGFARDMEFVCLDKKENEVVFCLTSNEVTKAKFPFSFELFLSYTLDKNTLSCKWKVINTDVSSFFFSIGAHPGFNLMNGKMSDYIIEFNRSETLDRYLLSGGLFNHQTESVAFQNNQLQLSSASFEQDAVVFKHFLSDKVTLRHKTLAHKVEMYFSEFPYLGIWSPKGCEEFVCIEPWCGLADNIEGHTDIAGKEGMNELLSGEIFEKDYSISFSV